MVNFIESNTGLDNLVLPSSSSIQAKLRKKRLEYLQKVVDFKADFIERYKLDFEDINSICSVYSIFPYKLFIVSKLLNEKEVNRSALAREISKKDGYIDIERFTMAFDAIRSYCEASFEELLNAISQSK